MIARSPLGILPVFDPNKRHPRLRRTGRFWGAIAFDDVKIHNPKAFKTAIDTSPDLIAEFRDGLRVGVPVLIMCSDKDPHNDAGDSRELARAMRASKNGGNARVDLYDLDTVSVPLTERESIEIVSSSVGFLNPYFESGLLREAAL